VATLLLPPLLDPLRQAASLQAASSQPSDLKALRPGNSDQLSATLFIRTGILFVKLA